MKYTHLLVERLAGYVTEFTEGQFRLATSEPGLYADKANAMLTWTGKQCERKAAAYYAGVGLRWAHLADTVAKLPDLVLEVAGELNVVRPGNGPVRNSFEYGRSDAHQAYYEWAPRHATAKPGERRTLTLMTRSEVIRWCGGRGPDDPGSDVMIIERPGVWLVVALGRTVLCQDDGDFKIDDNKAV